MSNIQTIIERLGYKNSDSLFYLSDIESCRSLSWHDRRVLKQLSPYAVYVVEGSVMTVFFEDLHTRENVDIQGKIWNAQIPVVISDEGALVKIYNGKSMELDREKKIRLLDIMTYGLEQCDEENDFSYWNITNSMSLGVYEDSLGKKSLNDFLIENLRYVTDKLKKEYHISFADKLMLRILFIRYLIDRGINLEYRELDSDVKKSQEYFLNTLQKKDELFALFRYLKEKFNGNLFELDEQLEKDEISEDALTMLYRFLTGQEEMRTGQLCLFPFYDFNIIPIELISNIYEILLGKEKQNTDKAFYTPEYLADYIVNRTVGEYLVREKECTVLDPSCGSGIFLVKSLQRMLENSAGEDGYIRDKNEINRLIKQNIFGVDYNEGAVDVTIFSLYVTLFDYQDPKKLAEFRLPLLKGENIIYGDFFNDEALIPFKNIDFKFILGNPPWGRAQQENYKKYCAGRNVKPQDGEICVAFLLKAQEVGNPDTECSLVIPSKILYKGKKPSLDFRRKLLSEVTLQQVLEISAVRKQLFKGAIAPAAVLTFVCKESSESHKIEYISLKPNKYLKLFEIIMIEPDDIKYVEQAMLYRYDELWKILVYGGYWDFELITSLQKKMPTISQVAKEHGFLLCKGIEDHVGSGQDAAHLMGRRILDSDGSIEQFELSLGNVSIFNKDKIHRVREAKAFEPPYVLFKKGLNCADYSIRAVYTEEKLLYKSTISCIKGDHEKKDILLNMEGLLNSSLFTYLNFMLGSSVGIEREQVFLNEISRFPYAYSSKLVELVRQMHLAVEQKKSTDNIKKEIDNCVFEMYHLQGNYFVDYALKIQIPRLCGRYVEEKCTVAVMEKYASVFRNIWNEHFERSNLYYRMNIYPNIKGKFAAFQMKIFYDEQKNDISVNENVDNDAERLAMFMIYKINDGFFQTKNVVNFEEDSFVIVKSLEAKNWHPAMAVKDCYSVLNAVLLGEEDSK